MKRKLFLKTLVQIVLGKRNLNNSFGDTNSRIFRFIDSEPNQFFKHYAFKKYIPHFKPLG